MRKHLSRIATETLISDTYGNAYLRYLRKRLSQIATETLISDSYGNAYLRYLRKRSSQIATEGLLKRTHFSKTFASSKLRFIPACFGFPYHFSKARVSTPHLMTSEFCKECLTWQRILFDSKLAKETCPVCDVDCRNLIPGQSHM
nr:hypothetical protein BgiMline_031720 [Biomphalaria glabrata]